MEARPGVLNIEEAAKVLRVSVPTLREAIHRGQVPALRVGNQFRLWQPTLVHQMSQLPQRQRLAGECGETWPDAMKGGVYDLGSTHVRPDLEVTGNRVECVAARVASAATHK